MDLARLILALLLVLVAGNASAYGEAPKVGAYTCTASVSPNVYRGSGGSPAAACAGPLEEALRYNYRDPYYGTLGGFYLTSGCPAPTNPGPGSCNGNISTAQGPKSMNASYTFELSCTDNSSGTASGKCECNMGFKLGAGGKCERYTCSPSGSYSGVVTPDIEVQTVGVEICDQGCGYTPGSVKAGADGKLWAVWPFKSTGGFCGGKPDTNGVKTGQDKGNEAPIPCGAGLCPGTVNGTNVCVACKDTTVPGSSSAASSPDGSSTETKSETKCTQSECTTTTTTTTKDSSGAVTGTSSSTKTEGQESFCKSNPDASVCKKSSFGGTCAATTCQGDAVQCAIAAEQYKRNCEWAQVDDAMKAKGTEAIGAGLRPADHPAANADSSAINFASAIDQTDRLGGGCPSDYTFSVSGQSYAIPFSAHCDKLQMIGQAMVAVCMLAAAFIVFRG